MQVLEMINMITGLVGAVGTAVTGIFFFRKPNADTTEFDQAMQRWARMKEVKK